MHHARRLLRAACYGALVGAASVGFGAAAARAGLRGEAYAGQPFGVAELVFALDPGNQSAGVDPSQMLAESNDRLLYPVLRERPVRRVLRQLLQIDGPSTAAVLVLFRGDAPLEIQTPGGGGAIVTLPVRQNDRAHARLQDQWWEQWTNRWQQLLEDPQFPPYVENFLTAQLARRLGRRLPEPGRGLLAASDERADLLGELFVTEAARLAIDRELAAGASAEAADSVGLPAPPPWFDLEPPPSEEGPVAIEPIAARTPAECFYVRFGSLLNYLWFRDLTRKWHGDLQNMVLRRAVDRQADERLERQLALRESALAKVLGPQVIADVALIGLDPYLADGAAVGILFQARNDLLLTADLMAQRREALQRHADATESRPVIAETETSLIATPDGSVRSYYVRDESFHLVTTSEHLARRFLQTRQGIGALAASPGFQHVRKQLPIARDDAVLAYVPPEFLRNLASPTTWIAAQRRVKALRGRALADLARRQAVAEGWVEDASSATLDQLIAGGLLPPGFGATFEGDAAEAADAAERIAAVDRTPLADRAIRSCSAEERSQYRRFAARFQQLIGQSPPLVVAAQRRQLPDGSGETARIEVLAAPLDGFRWGKAVDLLGEPSRERVAPTERDLVHLDAVVRPLLPLLGSDPEPHHLFAGLQPGSAVAPFDRGRLDFQALLRSVNGYLGTWPRPGMLAMLEANLPAEAGAARSGERPLQGQRRGEFLAFSFKPEVIEATLPQLRIIPVERPAQAWLEVRSLSGSGLEPLAQAVGYHFARQASQSGSRLLNALRVQLHVPAEACPQLAEELVDGSLTCPLGGEYRLVDAAAGVQVWNSSAYALEGSSLLSAAPAEFRLPLLEWFRGLRGEAMAGDEAARAELEIDLAKSAVP